MCGVRHRGHIDPLYLHARELWGDRIDLPTRSGTVRDPEVYEQDLPAAAGADEVR